MLTSTIIFVVQVIILYMTIWYFIALILERNDIADVAWGLGFIAVALSLYFNGAQSQRFMAILVLTCFWGVRLALHIYLRNKDKEEDYRYKQWREDWGKWFYVRTYFQVFILQGFFMLLISFSAIIASLYSAARLDLLGYLGIIVWAVGFFFESVGDYQLTKFIKDSSNKGKIMTEGLWKYTRHPNYFGEVTQWWGIFLIVLTLPLGWLAVISPVTITILILGVSGIPMLEKKYEGNKEFQEYKKRTNAFFPWFPKKK